VTNGWQRITIFGEFSNVGAGQYLQREQAESDLSTLFKIATLIAKMQRLTVSDRLDRQGMIIVRRQSKQTVPTLE
jgi:hypothetical protein